MFITNGLFFVFAQKNIKHFNIWKLHSQIIHITILHITILWFIRKPTYFSLKSPKLPYEYLGLDKQPLISAISWVNLALLRARINWLLFDIIHVSFAAVCVSIFIDDWILHQLLGKDANQLSRYSCLICADVVVEQTLNSLVVPILYLFSDVFIVFHDALSKITWLLWDNSEELSSLQFHGHTSDTTVFC